VDHSKVIQCNIRDITERVRTERALAKADAKLRSILDNIGIGVALISPAMEILELNRRIREWFPAVDPDQRPICYRSFSDPPSEVICENCPTHETFPDGLLHESARQTLSGGKVRDYRLVSSPIRNESGQVTAVIEMVEDITEKLSLESQFLQA
jgi:PAS domain-containing protein